MTCPAGPSCWNLPTETSRNVSKTFSPPAQWQHVHNETIEETELTRLDTMVPRILMPTRVLLLICHGPSQTFSPWPSNQSIGTDCDSMLLAQIRPASSVGRGSVHEATRSTKCCAGARQLWLTDRASLYNDSMNGLRLRRSSGHMHTQTTRFGQTLPTMPQCPLRYHF